MIAIDTHTHVYSSIQQRETLVAGGVRLLGASSEVDCAVLFLCEPCGRSGFGELRPQLGQAKETTFGAGWQVISTKELVSLTLLGPDGGSIVIIRGQQIVTSENLEVLAIGHEDTIRDGQSLDETIESCRTSGDHVILPWGAGKWLGSRGRMIDDVIERVSFPEFHIGDNGGRPAAWAVPQFKLAGKRNMKILNGSDPLPILGDESRIGTYASLLNGHIDMTMPWDSISSMLRDPEQVPTPMGKPMKVWPFLRSQLMLRVRNTSNDVC